MAKMCVTATFHKHICKGIPQQLSNDTGCCVALKKRAFVDHSSARLVSQLLLSCVLPLPPPPPPPPPLLLPTEKDMDRPLRDRTSGLARVGMGGTEGGESPPISSSSSDGMTVRSRELGDDTWLGDGEAVDRDSDRA